MFYKYNGLSFNFISSSGHWMLPDIMLLRYCSFNVASFSDFLQIFPGVCNFCNEFQILCLPGQYQNVRQSIKSFLILFQILCRYQNVRESIQKFCVIWMILNKLVNTRQLFTPTNIAKEPKLGIISNHTRTTTTSAQTRYNKKKQWINMMSVKLLTWEQIPHCPVFLWSVP